MNVREFPSGATNNGSDVYNDGDNNGSLETQSRDISEDSSEEISADTEAGSESEELDSNGEEENSTVDYSSILLSIDGRLENVESSLANLETNQLDIVDNTENTSLLIENFEEGFTIFTIVIIFSVICFAIYHWLDNFIK